MKVVTLGEIMLRLTPHGYNRLVQADDFEAVYGGAEAIVAAALAKCEDCEGPDLIFLPEVTFDVDAFMQKVAELHKKKKSVVVAVSEGVKLNAMPDSDATTVAQLRGDFNALLGALRASGVMAAGDET